MKYLKIKFWKEILEITGKFIEAYSSCMKHMFKGKPFSWTLNATFFHGKDTPKYRDSFQKEYDNLVQRSGSENNESSVTEACGF